MSEVKFSCFEMDIVKYEKKEHNENSLVTVQIKLEKGERFARSKDWLLNY